MGEKKMNGMEKVIEDIIEMTGAGEYEKTKKNRLGAAMLRDSLLDVLNDLEGAGVGEGHRYKELTILMRDGEQFPAPGSVRLMKGATSEALFDAHIVEIKDAQWVEEGIAVTFNGTLKLREVE